MGAFGSDSTSKSLQETNNVSDSGQLLKVGKKGSALIAQGGSSLVDNRNAKIGGLTGGNLTLGKDASLTINSGFDAGQVENLLAGANNASSSAISGVTGAFQETLGKVAGLLSQKTDTESGSPKTFAWVAVVGVVVVGFVLVKLLKK